MSARLRTLLLVVTGCLTLFMGTEAFAQGNVRGFLTAARSARASTGLRGSALVAAMQGDNAAMLAEVGARIRAGNLGESNLELVETLGMKTALSRLATQSATASANGFAGDAPYHVGRVEVVDDKPFLVTRDGRFEMLNYEQGVQTAWASNASGFDGRQILVKGFPTTDGSGISVREFAPGDNPNFVTGRIKRRTGTKEGIWIRVDPKKWVKIEDPEMERLLSPYVNKPGTNNIQRGEGVGVIMTGTLQRTGNGTDDWVLTDVDNDLWILTQLLEPARVEGSYIYEVRVPQPPTTVHMEGRAWASVAKMPERGKDLAGVTGGGLLHWVRGYIPEPGDYIPGNHLMTDNKEKAIPADRVDNGMRFVGEELLPEFRFRGRDIVDRDSAGRSFDTSTIAGGFAVLATTALIGAPGFAEPDCDQ